MDESVRLQARLVALTKEHGFNQALVELTEEIAIAEAETIRAIWRRYGPMILRQIYRREKPQLALVPGIREALGIAVPIATSGERRALGLIDGPAMLKIAGFRKRMANTLANDARVLERVAAILRSSTIFACWQKFTTEQRRVVLSLAHISLSDEEMVA